jgi:hypothetical protein
MTISLVTPPAGLNRIVGSPVSEALPYRSMQALTHSQQGQDLEEYALILSLIAVAARVRARASDGTIDIRPQHDRLQPVATWRQRGTGRA